jgi:hypothetical protein
MSTKHTTVSSLIAALGTQTEAAAILGAKSQSVVSMWIMRGKLPSRLFLEHTRTLEALGIEAEPRLWFERETPSAGKTSGDPKRRGATTQGAPPTAKKVQTSERAAA